MRLEKPRSLFRLLRRLMPAVALAQRYTVKDLGQLSPTGINSWSQVVGNHNGHAFVWNRWNGMRDLGNLAKRYV